MNVERNRDTVRRVVRDLQIHVPLVGVVDRGKEMARIKRDLAKLTKQRGALQARLSNPAFVRRADPDVVRETESQERKVGTHQEKLEQILREFRE